MLTGVVFAGSFFSMRTQFSLPKGFVSLLGCLLASFVLVIPAFSATTPATGAMSAGYSHFAALKADGSVWTWGGNEYGQLGDGTVVARRDPRAVPGINSAAGVAAGRNHTLVLKTDGTVWAWGRNDSGQLGAGDTASHSSPVAVSGLVGVIAIAAGENSGVALKSDGTVWAWGDNFYGQLGDGTRTGRSSPVRVANLTGVTALACGGGNHVLALKNDGTVWAWGSNTWGKIGNGSTSDCLTAAQVTAATGIVAIAAGHDHSLALKSNGTVLAWGDNENGQLGDGTKDNRTTPVTIPGLSEVAGFAAGDSQTLILKTDGTGWVTGNLRNEDVVDGAIWSHMTPAQIRRWSGLVGVAAGYGYSFGLKSDGTILFTEAYVGASDTAFRLSPIQVGTLERVVSAAAGSDHSVVARADGSVWAWGVNYSGQLGDGTRVSRYTPARVSSLSDVVAVSASDQYTLALKKDGTVWSWGMGGLLGDGTAMDRLTPVQVSGLSDVVTISASIWGGMALKQNGTVWTWGWNGDGNLGDGTTIDRLAPVQVAGLSGITAISNGDHAVALKNDGSVWVWGPNYMGELGNGTTDPQPAPVQVPGLTGVSAIASGGYAQTVALKSDGTVWTWGMNLCGQLGDGTHDDRMTPGQVVGLTNIVKIAAGLQYVLAVKNDGSVWGWGANGLGQLGDGTHTNRVTPAPIASIADPAALAPGWWHTLIIAKKGTLRGSGYNVPGVLAYCDGLSARIALRLTASPTDTNQNGIPDSWEMLYFNDLTHTGVADADGDGLSDLAEYDRGTNPTVADTDGDGHTDFVSPYSYYGGVTPTLTLLGGNYQFTYVDQFTSLALDAASWNPAGTAPFAGAPVTFTAAVGGGLLAQSTTTGTRAFPLVTLSTDTDGTARAFYKQPSMPNVVSQVLVTAGAAQKTFTTTSVSTGDSDANGLPDMWEYVNFGHIGVDPNADPDGDGLTNRQEAQSGMSPWDFFNGRLPLLSIASGNNQTGSAGQFNSAPLVVSVKDSALTPLINAPVKFMVSNGSGLVCAGPDGTGAAAVFSVRTGADGLAQAFFKQPSEIGVVTSITVTAGGASVTFSTSSLEENQFPVVHIVSPSDEANFTAPATIPFQVTASDSDGSVQKIELFANGSKIGETSIAPFVFTWASVPTGNYSITAVATDQLGAAAQSTPIQVNVSNVAAPPDIILEEPGNNDVFPIKSSISLRASAMAHGGLIAKVEFYANSVKIGEATGRPYALAWVAPATGSYQISAKALDTSNQSTWSQPVSIVVHDIGPLFSASFEAAENYSIGSVSGQNGWSTVGGLASITEDSGCGGGRGLILEPGTDAVWNFPSSVSSIAYVDFYIKPSVGATIDQSTRVNIGGAYLAFQLNGDDGEVFYGQDTDGWLSYWPAEKKFPLQAGAASSWLRITFRIDLSKQYYDLYFNGELIQYNLPDWSSEIAQFRLSTAGAPAVLDAATISTMNPLVSDRDNDGVSDAYELANGMDPTADDREGDVDRDGLINIVEYILKTRADLADTDGDGLPDRWEIAHGFNPKIAESLAVLQSDDDGDGLTLLQEAQNRTDPNSADTDSDGLSDGVEVENHLNPTEYDANADNDGDGVSNANEVTQGTDPNDYYNGVLPMLISEMSAGEFGPGETLSLRVTDAQGQRLSNAPVTFAVVEGGHLLAANAGDSGSATVTVRSNSNGVATVYVKANEGK